MFARHLLRGIHGAGVCVCVFFLLHFISGVHKETQTVPKEPLKIFNNSCCAHATGNEILILLKTIFIYFAYLFSFVHVTM